MTQRRPDRILGGNHDDFWGWCAKGELRLQRCEGCERLLWPVTRACEHCGGGAFRWERLSGRGRIVSWCAFHQDYYKGVLPVPYDTILVELEEGPLFISNPSGFDGGDIAAGMAVRVAFVDCEDAAGPFSLPVFERG